MAKKYTIREYNVKIEATESVNQTCGVDVLINGVLVDWFRWTDKALTDEVVDTLNAILDLQLDVFQLQKYLLSNLYVRKNRMTIKEIEQKLGIENIEIIE